MEKEEGETPGKKKGRKRKSEVPPDSEGKKSKTAKYLIEEETRKLIAEDSINKKLWDEALAHVSEGSKVFHDKVEELFLCICCQDIVFKPVTLECAHNICQSCLRRSFKAEVYSCPACRAELDKNISMAANKTLVQILNKLFPGYESGR